MYDMGIKEYGKELIDYINLIHLKITLIDYELEKVQILML